MIELFFWLSAVVIAYAYLGFPLLVILRGRLRARPPVCADITPPVSLIIVAHNEAGQIRGKLENLLELDYPRERLEIIVASDGSDDGTDEIITLYAGQGIKLVALPRQGKTASLNAAMAQAMGEVLVFSDANSLYAPDALRALVRPFTDPSVGGVAGSQRYVPGGARNSAGVGERAYWNFDEWLKRWESESGSVTSATGAIYAVRRELAGPVPGGVSDDAVISYGVVARGYRMVFEPKAIAYEPVASSARDEFQRKVRVCVRGLRGLLAVPQLFNPFRYGFYSVQLFSHKLLRWLMVWPLIILFLTSLGLHSVSLLYGMAAASQLIFYGFAVSAPLVRLSRTRTGKIPKIAMLAYYFCLVNGACGLAQWRVIRGYRIDSWEVKRSESPGQLSEA